MLNPCSLRRRGKDQAPFSIAWIITRAALMRLPGPNSVTSPVPSSPSLTPTIIPQIDSIKRAVVPPLPTMCRTAWGATGTASSSAAARPAGESQPHESADSVWGGGGRSGTAKRPRWTAIAAPMSPGSRVNEGPAHPRRRWMRHRSREESLHRQGPELTPRPRAPRPERSRSAAPRSPIARTTVRHRRVGAKGAGRPAQWLTKMDARAHTPAWGRPLESSPSTGCSRQGPLQRHVKTCRHLCAAARGHGAAKSNAEPATDRLA